jgi:PEGA domain
MRCFLVPLLVLVCLCPGAHGDKDKESSTNQSNAGLVMFWPDHDNAVLKLTFSRFQNVGTFGSQMTLLSNVVVQNLSTKMIPKASFSVALLDKDRVRVGSGILIIDDLGAGESARVQFESQSVGAPAILSLAARNNGGVPVSLKTTPLTVISVPAGASLKVDDKDEGVTPARINISVGTHQLVLAKEGFAVATTPLEVAPDEAPGGSITITLGGLTDDTIELRDGTILTADVMSMTLDKIVIEVGGKQQTLDRNNVKKIFLVERIITNTGPTAAATKKQAAGASPTPHP